MSQSNPYEVVVTPVEVQGSKRAWIVLSVFLLVVVCCLTIGLYRSRSMAMAAQQRAAQAELRAQLAQEQAKQIAGQAKQD